MSCVCQGHLTHVLQLQGAFQVNHCHPFVKAKFFGFFMLGKELEWGCSWNSGPALGTCLTGGPESQNSPVFQLYPAENCVLIQVITNLARVSFISLFSLSLYIEGLISNMYQ